MPLIRKRILPLGKILFKIAEIFDNIGLFQKLKFLHEFWNRNFFPKDDPYRGILCGELIARIPEA
jgi:hypothetical protein